MYIEVSPLATDKRICLGSRHGQLTKDLRFSRSVESLLMLWNMVVGRQYTIAINIRKSCLHFTSNGAITRYPNANKGPGVRYQRSSRLSSVIHNRRRWSHRHIWTVEANLAPRRCIIARFTKKRTEKKGKAWKLPLKKVCTEKDAQFPRRPSPPWKSRRPRCIYRLLLVSGIPRSFAYFQFSYPAFTVTYIFNYSIKQRDRWNSFRRSTIHENSEDVREVLDWSGEIQKANLRLLVWRVYRFAPA